LDSVDRLASTEEGVVALSDDDGETPWRLGPDGWKETEIAPPYQLHPDDDFGKAVDRTQKVRRWYETTLVFGPDRTIYAISANNASPGTRVTARLRSSRWVILGSEHSGLNSRALFVTPDGLLWNAWYGEILRFHGGRWEHA